MAVSKVPAGQVGAVVQSFVDDGATRVVAESDDGGKTYTVGAVPQEPADTEKAIAAEPADMPVLTTRPAAAKRRAKR